MEDLTEVRKNTGKFNFYDKAYLKLELPRCQFVIFHKAARLIEAGNGDGLMFFFSKKNATAWVVREDPMTDNYILSNSRRKYYRFTSKNLAGWFVDVFGLEHGKHNYYFEVQPKPDQYGNKADMCGYNRLVLDREQELRLSLEEINRRRNSYDLSKKK